MPKKRTKRPKELKPILVLEAINGDIRFTGDGSRPTLKHGHLLLAGTPCTWSPKAFAYTRFLPTSPKANLHVTFFSL